MKGSPFSLGKPLIRGLTGLFVLNLPLFTLPLEVFVKDQRLLNLGILLLLDDGICKFFVL